MRHQASAAGLLDGPISEVVADRAIAALANGCGNCGEQSAVAFMYLSGRGVRPLEWRRARPGLGQKLRLGRAEMGSASRGLRRLEAHGLSRRPAENGVARLRSDHLVPREVTAQPPLPPRRCAAAGGTQVYEVLARQPDRFA